MMYTPTGFSLTIFKDRYAFTETESWPEACERVAQQAASAEVPDKQAIYRDKFTVALKSNLFVPGGRIWANAGRPNPSLLNCFVLSDEIDSKEGWGQAAYNMIVTSMAGGGCGQEFSDIRPRGALIGTQRGCAPGAVELMRLIDACAQPVRNGGQRRVALMFSLDYDHPDIEEFLDAKLIKGQLTHANISVRCKHTKAFIKAIKDDGNIELHWKTRYKRMVKAKALWKTIVTNAYNSAEPGFLNWELVEHESNIYYIEELSSTNPCFAPGTLITTRTGIYPICDLVGKGVEVRSNGQWVPVSNFRVTGRHQSTIKIILHDGSEIQVTPEHTMILEDGTRCKAQDLHVGNKLQPAACLTHGDHHEKGAYLKGFLVGDECATTEGGAALLFVHPPKFSCQSRLVQSAEELPFEKQRTNAKGRVMFSRGVKRRTMQGLTVRKNSLAPWASQYKVYLPSTIFSWDHESKCEFIAGVMDADGTANDSAHGFNYQLSSVHREWLLGFQTLLKSIGVYATLGPMKAGRQKGFGDRRGGVYETQDCHRLTISQVSAVVLAQQVPFSRLVSFSDKTMKYTRQTRFNRVTEIMDAGVEPVVYCCTIPDTHSLVLACGIEVGQCGELALAPMEPCCLGHLVLHRFVREGGIDYAALADTIRLAVRFLDNVLTVNHFPLPEMKAKSESLRRIGLGTTGLADTLALLGLRYGSEDGNKFVDKIYRFISKIAYEASVLLAVEKGMFPLCEPSKHIESGFMKRMPHKIRSLVAENGIRNCAILTQAPTGCQKPDTLVSTDKGIFELQELGSIGGEKWQPLDLLVSQDTHGVLKKGTQFYNNGVSPTKVLTLSSGIKLESTPNHQYRVLTEGNYIWKRAERIVIGDKLVVKLGSYNKETEPTLGSVDIEDLREHMITQPSIMSNKLAEFLGYFYGDGSVHKKGIRIACNARENDYLHVQVLGEALFGIQATLDNNKRNCLSVCFNSGMLLRWLAKNGLLKQKSRCVEIPLLIRVSSKSSVQAFIHGYWSAGGSISKDNRYHSETQYIDTSSRKMAQQLLIVLRAIGQDTALQEHTSGMGSCIYRIKYIKTRRRCETAKNRSHLALLGLVSTTVDTVTSVKNSVSHTLDIEVPETCTYIANSVVSHNTVSILSGNCSAGIEPMFAPAYERRYWDGETRKTELVFHPVFAEFMQAGKSVEHFVGSHDLAIRDHLEVQRIVQKHVDNAVSKTINIPEHMPMDQMEAAWLEYLPYLKGTTFYRENTRGFVNKAGEVELPPLTAISLDEAKAQFNNASKIQDTGSVDCASGMCEL